MADSRRLALKTRSLPQTCSSIHLPAREGDIKHGFTRRGPLAINPNFAHVRRLHRLGEAGEVRRARVSAEQQVESMPVGIEPDVFGVGDLDEVEFCLAALAHRPFVGFVRRVEVACPKFPPFYPYRVWFSGVQILAER